MILAVSFGQGAAMAYEDGTLILDREQSGYNGDCQRTRPLALTVSCAGSSTEVSAALVSDYPQFRPQGADL
jgi:hypothetical protein